MLEGSTLAQVSHGKWRQALQLMLGCRVWCASAGSCCCVRVLTAMQCTVPLRCLMGAAGIVANASGGSRCAQEGGIIKQGAQVRSCRNISVTLQLTGVLHEAVQTGAGATCTNKR